MPRLSFGMYLKRSGQGGPSVLQRGHRRVDAPGLQPHHSLPDRRMPHRMMDHLQAAPQHHILLPSSAAANLARAAPRMESSNSKITNEADNESLSHLHHFQPPEGLSV